MDLIKKLFSRRWVGGTILVFVAIGLFVRLGIWQLDRLEQRRAENAVLQVVLDSPPLDLAEPLPDAPEALENRLATVTGRYDFAHEWVLLLQTWQGRPGVQLVTPLMIEGSETAVLVNRGWVPQADYDEGAFDQYRVESGVVQIEGYLALSQPSRGEGNEAAGSELYRIEIPAIQAALPYELLPVFLVESPGEDVELNPPLRAAREVDLSEGPHLGYAVQWFIFSLLTGGLYLVFVRRSERERPSSPKNES
ncbi:SURF1 family protein [Candidatus Leptofilum sp.]|uniref:SURF1 family protein n=1 Tax=Candidatus Leptofilum sp. TaxID=3241576 RepID=UPI003B5A95B1